MYQSTKTYGHEIGLSCAFRQWRAESHCRFVHGYALAIKIVFEAVELDVRGWVVDFGSLKSLRGILEENFDHKLIIAADDPERPLFQQLHRAGVCDLIEMPGVGCERFAEFIFDVASQWLHWAGYAPRVRVTSVEVREHGANSAIYTSTKGE